ncbi:putative membrane protein ActII-3 [Rhizocola hellebori]|uniref:Putative membrane protein ActII-3 n=1 Tax=Rhizocola hellebori TaxID=1392758 RepID=A0A8J3QGH3_9ACTN|nr:MMPL family transporter [Rhizocola hellebori]GIH10425.1 putative membrane protein ActII-3 [Rhizocola hellebori]
MKYKWPALGAWLLVAALTFLLSGSLTEVESNDVRAWLPASAESTRAIDLADKEFSSDEPEDLLIVYARDTGLTDADRDAVAARAAELGAQGPLPSDDGKALMLVLPFTAAQSLDHVRSQAAVAGGLTTKVTGRPAAEADFDKAFDSLDTTLLLVTVAVVAVLLLLTYRSPVLLLLPLISVALANQLATAIVYGLSKHLGLVVDPQSAGILTVLVFGAGTDYAMLLISRYREELQRNENRPAAMASALRRSLPAIAASATTVILALLALVFADLNSTRGLGPVAAIGIACALLAMTTLLPALILLGGRWVFWPSIPKRGKASFGMWGRIAAFVTSHARAVWIVTALGLAAASLGATTLSVGLREAGSFTTKPESVAGFELLAAHYPAGSSEPAQVYLPTPAAKQAASQIAALPGVDHVEEPEQGDGWTGLKVVLSDDPGGQQAEATVKRIRETVRVIDPAALVGGSTAQRLDQDSTMDRDLRLVIPLILVIVLGVLIVLLRAFVAPLLLLGSVVLSFGAALGVSAAIFHLIGFPTLDKSVVLNGFLFLVALGVDYTIFLMVRAREDGMPKALAVTGGVITSAGLVLAATFAVLTVMPIVFMMQLGVLVAIGVLLDTFVVRTLLVPALVLDLGRRGGGRTP